MNKYKISSDTLGDYLPTGYSRIGNVEIGVSKNFSKNSDQASFLKKVCEETGRQTRGNSCFYSPFSSIHEGPAPSLLKGIDYSSHYTPQYEESTWERGMKIATSILKD